MIVCYHRSSSLGTLEFCEQKYFLQYNLSYKDKTNKKALMGTITHKVMQILGDKSLAVAKGEDKVVDDELGTFTLEQCDDLSHVNDLAFDYYASSFPEVVITDTEKRTCLRWAEKAVAYQDGMFDPRNQDVFATELFFDIEIQENWAKYNYRVGKENVKGNLAIKGTVDLIVKQGENYYEILDYKTGKRINWATGEEKTLEKLQKDTQLLLYYYALKNMYPEAEFSVSIFYINAGGVFSMVFDEDDYKKAENILRQKFEKIKRSQNPKLLSNENSHWKCRKLCKFSQPYKEGSKKSVCQHIRDEIRKDGILKVVEKYGDVNKLSAYGDGGGRLAEDTKKK
jgi:CRISPR/Cas system-associated exonuclease Cas4 (RecB family)